MVTAAIALRPLNGTAAPDSAWQHDTDSASHGSRSKAHRPVRDYEIIYPLLTKGSGPMGASSSDSQSAGNQGPWDKLFCLRLKESKTTTRTKASTTKTKTQYNSTASGWTRERNKESCYYVARCVEAVKIWAATGRKWNHVESVKAEKEKTARSLQLLFRRRLLALSLGQSGLHRHILSRMYSCVYQLRQAFPIEKVEGRKHWKSMRDLRYVTSNILLGSVLRMGQI